MQTKVNGFKLWPLSANPVGKKINKAISVKIKSWNGSVKRITPWVIQVKTQLENVFYFIDTQSSSMYNFTIRDGIWFSAAIGT